MNSCFPSLTSPLQARVATAADVSQLAIRNAEPKDIASLATILAESFHPPEGWMRFFYPVLRLGIYEDLRQRINSSAPGYLCLVAYLPSPSSLGEEELLGTVEMTLRSSFLASRGCEYPYISNLAVRQAYRRRGVAQKLLANCEHQAGEWGFQDLYLHVLENNYRAKQLYINRGYRTCQTESNISNWLFQNPNRQLLNKRISTKTSNNGKDSYSN